MTSQAKRWNKIKGQLIAKRGRLTIVANEIGCHPNALRHAVEGRAPKVKAKMEALLGKKI